MGSARRCPVCGAAFRNEPVERWTTYELLSCPSCDLQLWDPPTPGNAAWYDSADHYLAAPIVDWLGWYHRWGLAHLPSGARSLIDIGCADGRFVYAACAKDIDAVGIDHSERMVNLGNARHAGSRLSRRSIDEFLAAGRTFDVVTLFEVLEHVPDPLSLLRLAHTLLVPSGTLIVSVPNREGRPRAPEAMDRPPHHLSRWTPTALAHALNAGGMEVMSIGLSPGDVGIRSYLLDKVRLGLVVRLLRRRASMPSANVGGEDVRRIIRAKESTVALVATLTAPFIGHWFRGGSMVMVAQKKESGDS